MGGRVTGHSGGGCLDCGAGLALASSSPSEQPWVGRAGRGHLPRRRSPGCVLGCGPCPCGDRGRPHGLPPAATSSQSSPAPPAGPWRLAERVGTGRPDAARFPGPPRRAVWVWRDGARLAGARQGLSLPVWLSCGSAPGSRAVPPGGHWARLPAGSVPTLQGPESSSCPQPRESRSASCSTASSAASLRPRAPLGCGRFSQVRVGGWPGLEGGRRVWWADLGEGSRCRTPRATACIPTALPGQTGVGAWPHTAGAVG